MPHLRFRGTEDPDTMLCYVTATKRPIGWIRKVQGGYGYRTLETDPWTYGPKLRHEAADLLLSISDLAQSV